MFGILPLKVITIAKTNFADCISMMQQQWQNGAEKHEGDGSNAVKVPTWAFWKSHTRRNRGGSEPALILPTSAPFSIQNLPISKDFGNFNQPIRKAAMSPNTTGVWFLREKFLVISRLKNEDV